MEKWKGKSNFTLKSSDSLLGALRETQFPRDIFPYIFNADTVNHTRNPFKVISQESIV